jgi:hypothetical protein
MKFHPIKKTSRVERGEYLLHTPSQQIVLCGAIKREEGVLRVLANGRLLEDKIENFQKILLPRKDLRKRKVKRPCTGCKGS